MESEQGPRPATRRCALPGCRSHAREAPPSCAGTIARRETGAKLFLFPVVDDEIRAATLRRQIAEHGIERVVLQPVVPQRDSVGVVSHAAAVLNGQHHRIGGRPRGDFLGRANVAAFEGRDVEKTLLSADIHTKRNDRRADERDSRHARLGRKLPREPPQCRRPSGRAARDMPAAGIADRTSDRSRIKQVRQERQPDERRKTRARRELARHRRGARRARTSGTSARRMSGVCVCTSQTK